MVPQEKVLRSTRRHEVLEVAEDSSDSSSSCSVESTRRTTHPNKAPLDSVTQEEDPVSSSMQKSVKKSTSSGMSLTSLLRLSPPVEHVVLGTSESSVLRSVGNSSNVCCSPVAFVDDASVSDISTGSCCTPGGSPRSIFKAYWDKSGEPAPPLMRATSASVTSTTASSSMSSSMSSVPLHVGGSAASPRPFQDPSRLDYEDSLLLTKEETPTTKAAGPPQDEHEDANLRRRSIIGQHGYRSNSEPSLCLQAMASRSAPTVMTPPGTAAAGITNLACFFAPFRKTRSASTLHDHHKASSSIGAPATSKSCLRRGRFSSSSFGDMTISSKIQPEELPSSPVLSDAGSVTFNEDDNRVVVFDSPRELWSQRGWSDYFAC